MHARLRGSTVTVMASQISVDDCDFYDIASFIRGYHAYKELWDPNVGQVLKLRKEPGNCHDRRAVAVVNAADTVLEHVPYNLAPILSHFLAREFNKGIVHVTGVKVNRGAGYGLEVPCIYRLYGPKAYLECLKKKIEVLQERGFLPSSHDL